MDGIGNIRCCPGTLRAILESTYAEDLEDNGWTRTTVGHRGSIESWTRGDTRLVIVRVGAFDMGYVIGTFRTIGGVEVHMPNVRCADTDDLAGAVRAAFDVLMSVGVMAAETGGRISDLDPAEIVIVRPSKGVKIELGLSGIGESVIEYSRNGTMVTLSAALYRDGEFDDELSEECPLDPTAVGMMAQELIGKLLGP